MRPAARLAALLPAMVVAALAASAMGAAAVAQDHAMTFYVGRISSANAWHDLLSQPFEARFVDAYLAVAAWSHVLARSGERPLSFEAEGQLGYNFGDQSHWESQRLRDM